MVVQIAFDPRELLDLCAPQVAQVRHQVRDVAHKGGERNKCEEEHVNREDSLVEGLRHNFHRGWSKLC